MRIMDVAVEADKALVTGIGGGGDVISAVYVKEFFEKFGVKCVCGGVVWERYRRDRKPGPRGVDEIEGIEKIFPTLGYVSGNERVGGIRPIVSQVAEFLGERVLAVSIKIGVRPLKKDLKNFIEENSIDLVIGVDAGGDSLGRGFETGLTSPLADSMMLAALNEFRSILAVVGFGSDGELERPLIERYLSEMHSSVLGVSMIEVSDEFLDFLGAVESEASKIPAMARNGFYGEYLLWGETRIHVSILNSLVFYLSLNDVYRRSEIAGLLEETESITQANRILNELGIKTELDLEMELAMRDGLL